MALSVSKVEIMGRVHHLTIKIYREILCITTDSDGMKKISVGGFDPVYSPTWTSQYRIVLSCALLNSMTREGRIPFSFTNFITTQELSGPFYISPDIYGTQISEYSLMTLNG